ncbi:MAG: CRTAC1 family protein [Planctomycetota bacterium]|nr:CRTAC1 family protein [Planctomycetota bacterium]
MTRFWLPAAGEGATTRCAGALRVWVPAIVGTACAAALLLAGCAPKLPPPTGVGPIQLTDVSRQVGIDFVHTDGSSGRRYIVEAMSAGLATFDYDGDGLIDIYFLNGAPLRGTTVAVPPTHHLYRNEGDWQFRDVTDAAGIGELGFGLGVTVGDYDNDGFPDLYANNYGANALYHNNGDGTFTAVTRAAGVGNGELVGAGTCFLDMDGDGDLDLYVGNYLDFSYEEHVVHTVDGIPRYPLPRDYVPVPDTLFRNNGDGTFTDVSAEAGISRVSGTTMGVVAADYDRDGDTDLLVVCDVAENLCFRNDGHGHFTEVGVQNGTAYNGTGDANGSMGVDCGDCDNDGWLDFFVTSYQSELPVLYRNLGDGTFEDATQTTQAGTGCLAYVKWGTGLIDFNNDGHLDIFIANGHTEDNVELWDRTTCYRCRNSLLLNDGTGHFQNISNLCGNGLLSEHAGRGAAFDDLDNDGDIDVVVQNSREAPTVLRNDTRNGNHWLEIILRGVTSNRDAVGTQVTVVAGDLQRVAEVHSGRGYQSHFGSRLHFGLGPHPRVDSLRIRWLGGASQELRDLAADQLVTIVEGCQTVVPIRRP